MSAILDQYLKNIGDAKVYETGVFFEPGNFVVDIQAFVAGATRQGRPFLACETMIKWSDNPSRLPGSKCTHMIMLDTDSAMSNVKKFIAGVEGVQHESIPKEHWDALVRLATGPNQPLKNRRCRVCTVPAAAGKKFTPTDFFPYDGKYPAAI